MRLLLDTNALLWAAEGNPRLGRKASALIADHDSEVLFSIVSLWEILIKIRSGKMHLDWRKLAATASEAGFRRIDLSFGHVEAFENLPVHHNDPFDHMILAQTIAEGATLVTSDGLMTHYDVPILKCG